MLQDSVAGPEKSCFPKHTARGPTRRRVGVRDFEIQWISRFRFRFQDFSLDFRISCWISGFLAGFPDFALDFWISGFQVGISS